MKQICMMMGEFDFVGICEARRTTPSWPLPPAAPGPWLRGSHLSLKWRKTDAAMRSYSHERQIGHTFAQEIFHWLAFLIAVSIERL
jgi:hypothetical protein